MWPGRRDITDTQIVQSEVRRFECYLSQAHIYKWLQCILILLIITDHFKYYIILKWELTSLKEFDKYKFIL